MLSAPGSSADDSRLFRVCVVPFVVFLGFNLLLAAVQGGWQWDHPAAPWWQRAPELWVYALQVLACGGYLFAWRRDITWRARPSHCLWGVAAGLLGIGLWLIPYLLGWVPREGGFEPELLFGSDSAATVAAYALRFARAVLIVPLAEELFWRGYLMRWCIDRDFPARVPLGRVSWFSYIVVTLGFILVHRSCDWAGAACYGSLAYVLVWRTRSLLPVILMHATANLVMGVAAIRLDLPQLW